ncbi:MAG: type IV toxin-antitoxin system AbiEi family antitoxin domain-containing protein [Bacilli bacterium]|nr:type IV toxin-antitoxin system AbiEi family antitoxin domain-containing protein [Bacilli bacterium]
MVFISEEDFIKESNFEIIKKLMECNNGYITTKQLENLGISRNYLSIMKQKDIIEKVAKGVYIDSKKIEDVYYVFGMSTPKIIYSHMTALYFHNLSIKAPNDSFDVTVTKKYNSQKLKKHNVFYVDEEYYNVGVVELETPQGNKIKAYDIERCICDIIRSKKRMDMEHVKYSIKEYLRRKDNNLIKLSKYADMFGIKEEVMDFVSMMYE